MATHRFQVSSVHELNPDKTSSQPSEMIPLINIENDVPKPPPLPISFTSIKETSKSTPRIFNNVLQRLKTSLSTTDIVGKVDSSSLPVLQSKSITNLIALCDFGGGDSCQSTIHSNTFDTDSLRVTNKFLDELRSKRRELHDKAKNLPIDQRIALNRYQYRRDVLPAQDIFDIHFELNDNDTIQNNFFDEDVQEQIRNKIFHELDRQRMKEYHKQHRHLVMGRALLMFVTSLLAFMAITVIYVVITLFDRAKYLDKNLADNEFLSMIYDKTADV